MLTAASQSGSWKLPTEFTLVEYEVESRSFSLILKVLFILIPFYDQTRRYF